VVHYKSLIFLVREVPSGSGGGPPVPPRALSRAPIGDALAPAPWVKDLSSRSHAPPICAAGAFGGTCRRTAICRRRSIPTGSPLRVPSVYAALSPQRSPRYLVALSTHALRVISRYCKLGGANYLVPKTGPICGGASDGLVSSLLPELARRHS